MLMRGCLLLLLYILGVRSQDATGTCNTALGLLSGTVEDSAITSPLGEDSTPSAGRLDNSDGAWCFSNDSIASQSAALLIDLGYRRFVSGFGSQGPPEKIQPKSYNHLVAFSTSYSQDQSTWENFNSGNFFFDVDKNETSDVINYHVSSSVAFTQYVKINVIMQISGSTTICLRFELYGCDTDIQPLTSVQAMTTTKGKIQVKWQQPEIETSLDSEKSGTGILSPGGYAVLYRPVKSQTFATTTTIDKLVALEDVRLGATYIIQLQCLYKDVVISCGSTQVEAYPPCPVGFTGGNEYHCFLHLSPVASFAEARKSCLNPSFDQQLGQLGYIVDEEERKFLVSRILPKSVSEVWLVGNLCQEKEDCCTILKVSGEDTLEDAACGEETLKSALCLRDHKGEGARIRVSKVEASDDGSSAWVTWRYEGIGWKTDELQVKIWESSEDQASTLTFTTLNETFEIKAEVATTYSFLLRPAPNIRTEEFVFKFIIIDFQDGVARYGAVLTPVPMSVYIIWSGSLRVTWDEAKALSKSGDARPANKYSIAHQILAPVSDSTEVVLESEREFQLTPIEMKATYVFKMACHFVNDFHPCGEISITTDPPDLVLYKPSKVYIVYEAILDKAKTWADGEDDCQQRAGHLTSLLDDSEAKALLKMLPSKDAKMWTGAKLGREGTGYWTDGEKITDLPMAKNSGVTSSSESCCRAINETGKLRLAGGNCEDRHPYICKYTVQEILTIPGNLAATTVQWDSFDLSWSKPVQRWFPTFYNVQACQAETKTDCKVKKDLKNLWTLKLENLQEFQKYSVTVEAVLEPVDVKKTGEMTVMTYPKSQVQVNISSKGKCTVSTPILIAKGLPTATVTVVLHQLDVMVVTVKGGLKDVVIPGLVPEEVYKMVVKHDDGEWTHEMSINAVPTCPEMDTLVDSVCYHIKPKMPRSSGEAKKYCLGVQPSQERNPMSLWKPQSEEELKKVVTSIDPRTNVWVDKPKDGIISNKEPDAACSTGGDPECCFYDVSKSKLVCTACCDRKIPFICSHTVKKANLGEVTNLLPSFVGNTSISVEWGPPDDISWSIRRFEVEWRDKEKNDAVVGKDIVVGGTEKKIEGLEYGNEYEVAVTPLGATAFRGETAIILITTLDPRTPITAKVDPDGTAIVHSPLLNEKGRGSEQVEVRLFKIGGSTQELSLLYTVSGQAQKVDIAGLELGQKYWVEMTPKVKDKMFNYSTEFSAFPSCSEDQIQEGLVCVWAPPQPKSWREAAEICREDNGELLDYKTQEELTQPIKARLTSYIQQNFWLDVSGSEAIKDFDSSKCVDGIESDVMCCTYEVNKEGELNDLKCACCDEPRHYVCMKLANIKLGDIGEVLVEDITTTSLTVSWTMSSSTKWQEPSFLITWKEISNRQKREVGNQMIANKSPAKVNDLKSGTEYNVAVAPFAESTKIAGEAKDVTVSTRPDITMAGLMQEEGCTVIVLKISCCVIVIVGCAFTVFVFIATRMFYLDCLAQMFTELGTFGAYVCILVSSAQSYSNDSQCLRAHQTLCVAVSVLIQFFFQVIFLFIFLEALLICSTLKDYLPSCCNYRSPLGMAISGFGIPAIMMIVLAAVASDGFSDGDDNCWLDLQGNAMLPSVIPVVVFGSFACILLVSIFDVDEPKEDLTASQKMRGRIFLKTRWACFAVLALMSVCYGTGMTGANDRDATLTYVFIGFSTAMGILIPILRIRCDDEVREQLKRGLFTSLRDDMGAIRVSPAPDKYGPNPLLNMSEFESRKYKQQQLEGLKIKESINTETVWHQ